MQTTPLDTSSIADARGAGAAGRPGPRVTIGLPVFNGERFVAQAIAALTSQTFEDLEIIISDNASTDRTMEICEAAAEADPRVRVIRQRVNLGAAGNYNALVDAARGSLFRWAPHDDLASPDHIARLVGAIDAAGPGTVLAFPQTTVIDADGTVTDRWTHRHPWDGRRPSSRLASLLLQPDGLLHECSPVVGLIRTRALRASRRIGPFAAADKVLLAELAMMGDFAAVEEPLYLRRMHDGTHLAANRDPAAVAEWFDPHRRRGPRPTPRTELARGYASAVARARLPVAERVACLGVVGRWLASDRNWRVVGGELRRSASARATGLRPART